MEPLVTCFTSGLLLLLCWPIACVADDKLEVCPYSSVWEPRDQTKKRLSTMCGANSTGPGACVSRPRQGLSMLPGMHACDQLSTLHKTEFIVAGEV